MIKPALFRSVPCFAIAGVVTALVGCNRASNEYVAPPPPKVTVAHPVSTEITPFLEQNGRTEASEEAEIRARVRGFIQAIDFQPGQSVKAGRLLYKIEPDQYQAEVNSAQAAVSAAEASIGVAEANIKTAEAEVGRAEQDLKREEQLKVQQASSQAQYDAALAAFDAAKASVESAKANAEAARAEKGSSDANLAQAQLDLGYTNVGAPIEGRITKTFFKLGNLVENGSHLATVVDDNLVFANFSISDRDLLEFMKARQLATGADEDEFDEREWRGHKVYLRRETDEGFPFEGKLDYVDQSGIQSETGTLGLRATFDNSDGRLVPGLFVTVRVPASDSVKSLLVPEASLLRSDQGVFVMIVNSDNVVERRRVTVGQTVTGWAIIQEGLTESDQVVVDGLQRARPTLEVIPESVELEADGESLLRGQGQPSAQPMPATDATQPPQDATQSGDATVPPANTGAQPTPDGGNAQ
ncbi:MAG: efflux RND transporter periplasmic adaptor subunit [Rubripirellula sp.]